MTKESAEKGSEIVKQELRVVNLHGEMLFETEGGIKFDELGAANGLLNGSLKICREGEIIGQTTAIKERGTILLYESIEGLSKFLPAGYLTSGVLWPEWFQENDVIIAEGFPSRDETIRIDEDWCLENLENYLIGQALSIAARNELIKRGRGEELEYDLDHDFASWARKRREMKDELGPSFQPPEVIRIRRR